MNLSRFRLTCLGLILVCALSAFLWLNHRLSPQSDDAARPVIPANDTTKQASAIEPTNAAPPGAALVATTADTASTPRQTAGRPLPVTRESAHFQWTSADAKDPNVIRQIAHNEREYERMVEENSRIQRRQLVYSKNPAAAILQRARLSGETVAQLALPGFDGQEMQFLIEHADLEPSRQVGTFTGQLAGRPGSLVTLAFKFGREAFTILSPEDGTYLQGHPRDSGEIILTSFDPDTYIPLPGGEPIRTSK
jgi:hypothetical protein